MGSVNQKLNTLYRIEDEDQRSATDGSIYFYILTVTVSRYSKKQEHHIIIYTIHYTVDKSV